MDTMTNDAQPITTGTDTSLPTDGTFVTVEGMQALPRTADGAIDWKSAGFEVETRDEDGDVLQVIEKKVTYTGAVNLRVDSIEKAMKYLGEARLLAGLNANGLKVKGQAKNREYLSHLKETRAPAWESDGTLKPVYQTILLQKVWASYAGIQLEKRQGERKVVEKIVEVKVIVLPDGSKWKVDPQNDESPEMQLCHAWIDALMQDGEEADDAVAAAKKKLEKGTFAKMLSE